MTQQFALGMKVFSLEDEQVGVIRSITQGQPTVTIKPRKRGERVRKISELIPLTPIGYFEDNQEANLANSIKKGDKAILNTDNALFGNAGVNKGDHGTFDDTYWCETDKCWKAYVNFPSYGGYWHGLLQELVQFNNQTAKHSLEKI